MRRVACPATNLRMSHPRLARPDEWNYARNAAAGVTPDMVLSGTKRVVSWLCEKHGPYETEIRIRAHCGTGCVPCGLEAGKANRRQAMRVKGREKHALAARARARLASGRDGAPASDDDGVESD
jgi:Probable Zinc-ribbon domain